MTAPQGMYDVAMKPVMLRSLLREYVPDDKHPFTNPSDLLHVVSTVKTHKLLSEPQDVQQDLVDACKSAVGSWLNRLNRLLALSNSPDKCWAGICLLGITFQECSSERFFTLYEDSLTKLLSHIKPSVSSHLVKVAACASLSDMFTRLSEFPNAKKDGSSSPATKVIQPLLKLLNEDSSAVEEAMCLLCTLINFFPSSVRLHYDNVEAAIVSKLISGKCCPSMSKKLGRGLSLLPKSRADEASWCTMMSKILIYINSQLNDAFQGLEEEAKSAKVMKALFPASKEFSPPPPLGGLATSEQNSDISIKRPERLIASRICSLLQCCSDMLTTSYPVEVSVPVSGLIALAGRVLMVDGSLSVSSYSFMTTLKHEFICSEIPILQFQSLEFLTAIVKCLGSQLLRHVADISQLLKEYMRICKLPDLKIKAYSVLKVLLMTMGVGLAVYVSQDIVSHVFIDLDFFGDEKDSKSSGTNTKKKRKHNKSSLQEQAAHGGPEVERPNNLTPLSVKIAALQTLEALLTVGGSIRSESWRGDVDKLLINVATYASRGGCSKEERKSLLSGEAMWADFQLAAFSALLASLLSRGRERPPHLELGLELFCKGKQATDTRLAELCGHALLSLEVFIHPRSLQLSDFRSGADDYEAPGQSRNTHHPGEPESEDDDLNENWPGKDDEMEIQVTERQHDAHYADNPRDASSDKFPCDKVTTSGNGPNEQPANGGGLAAESCGDVLQSVELESAASRRGALVDNGVAGKSDAISEVGKGIEASTSEHISETTGKELAAIVERMSCTLSYTDDRSKGMMFESDNESADSLPDIVDGDPDSD